ncbi:phospholipase B1, membrane-associated-like [Ruditapes philippinarum]|uniref:phospholipase B1, membrane-associated-like n=1 Tax=Ruditapes philippinarum TaxID=129788 RepID=UPI00295AE0B8|nr:phospholipase B1, membrane-associated-like [Ruditapes philippinarum]
MIWIYCFLGLITLGCVGADYAKYEEFVRQQSKNATFVRMFEKHLSQFQDHDKNLRISETFPCKAFPQPQTKTTSVHKLRPMDVSVIGALGDSITAGTGITAGTVLGLLQEDRGLSWSVGGDKTVNEEETIPNILKVYSPNIKGYSTGSGPVWWEPSSHLNVADPGDKSDAMPGQAKTIVERMKADKNINYDEDWKVITLFVGGNDLCDFCGSGKVKVNQCFRNTILLQIEPVGKKRTKWTPGEKVECPSAESPYFFTYKNSDNTDTFGDSVGKLVSEVDNSNAGSGSSSNQSGPSSVSMTIIATVAGVLIVAFVSVMSVVAWRRRHSNKEERDFLLRNRNKQYYAPI